MPRDFAIRKYALGASAAAIASCVAYVALGWLAIFAFGPEHPEIAPRRLFEDLLSAVPWVTALFAVLESLALLCAVRLVLRVQPFWVAVVSAVVSIAVVFLSLLFPSFISFQTPLKAVSFTLSFIILTFASLRMAIYFQCVHERQG